MKDEILCCPTCKGDLQQTKEALVCLNDKQHRYQIIDGIPVFESNTMSWDITVANDKWHEFYQHFDWEKERQHYVKANLPFISKHLNLNKDDYFLEIGGGPSFLSFELTEQVSHVVIIDFDLDILRIAKQFFEKHQRQAIFICANVHSLPFKDNVFNCSSGIGVIEHTKAVNITTNELQRVTKKGGYTFQTVPYFSLLTLANNSIRYGSFTPIRFINWLISFFHVRIFKCKYMKYGYEELYTKAYMSHIFDDSKFKQVVINFYDYNQTLFQKYKLLARVFYSLIRLNVFGIMPFADVVYIKAYK